jgi:hypothetical protein
MSKEWNVNAFQNSYRATNLQEQHYWAPEVTLEGSTYLTEERNGSKGPNLDVEDKDDDIIIIK